MERKDGLTWVGGLLLGAAGMYLLDPRSGRQRRALLRDQLTHATHSAEHSARRLGRDFSNRTHGTVARAKRLLTPQEQLDNRRLEARVRATLGRLCSHANRVSVEVDEGAVTLGGSILRREVGDVLTGIRRVPGVRSVVSHLEAVENKAELPGGAGKPRSTGTLPDLLQAQPSPSSRALLAAAGAASTVVGLRQGGLRGYLGALAGGLMLARAALNLDTRPDAAGNPRAVTVQRTLTVDAPVTEVFAFWSNFRNFATFMRHIREVSESDSGISHWVADGPLGLPVSWDAEITALQAHRRLAWRSLEGSEIRNAGEVRFEDMDEHRTRLHVRLTFHPPAGALGHTVASLFGADPERQIAEDLARLKQILESGPKPAPAPAPPFDPAPVLHEESAALGKDGAGLPGEL